MFSWVLRLQLAGFAAVGLPSETTKITASNLILSSIKFDSRNAIANGGFCRLFRGTHPIFGAVALKRLQLIDSLASQGITLFEAEVKTWKLFDHPNILPFLGTFSQAGHLYLVSPWAEGGALPRYLSSNLNADRPKF
ncbi:hypothetical protein FRB99_001855, partial [Tulasnella sp. 403]